MVILLLFSLSHVESVFYDPKIENCLGQKMLQNALTGFWFKGSYNIALLL